MNLYVFRHGIAVDSTNRVYPDDSQRPLTAKGAEKMRRIASALRSMEVEADLICSSPYLRARQTAEILARSYNILDKLILTPGLLPEAPAVQIIEEINQKFPRCQNVILVGHQPSLINLITTLTCGDQNLKITLKKGGLCHLRVEQLSFNQCATLEWLLYPFQLANLAALD